MGSLGLVVFAFLVWKFEPRHSHWMVLIAATVLEQFLCAVSVSLPSDGRGVPWIGRRHIRSRRTPSANGRTPWVANPVLHIDRKPAPCPEGVVSGWQLSPRRCNALRSFLIRSPGYLKRADGRTCSPFRSEAE